MSNEESPLVRLDDSTIIPASITQTPNLYHHASGAISVASADGTEVSAAAVYDLFTSWRILGSLEVDLTTSWNVGESNWYWYRVEGECGSVNCDDFGIGYDGCPRMRFVTTLSARNLAELCDTLKNPATNAPVNLKVATIHRYSRPVFRDQTQPDQCNVLQSAEFCHVPECLDYCVEDATIPLIKTQNIIPAHEDIPAVPDFPGLKVRSRDEVSAATEISEILVARSSMSASAFGLGYEYDESLSGGTLEAPSDSISVCGCSGIGQSLAMRHSLVKSSAVSNFLKSNGTSIPSSLGLKYKAADSSWTSTLHLGPPDGGWTLFFGFSCQDELWRLSLSLRGGRKQTRLVVDIPPEFMCVSRRPSASIQVYFDQRSSLSNSEGIQVVTPARTPRKTASFSAEVFVDGIFVPHVVYYDELGLFSDSFWDHSPLEIDINPIAKNPTTLMNLNGIA